MSTHYTPRSALCHALIATSLLLTAIQSHAVAVARVALSVGEARHGVAGGSLQPLKLGAVLNERDRILTGPDAMVIVIFSDQGRLAVRPDSEVIIRSYRVDPSGTDTRLDIELIRGAVRQISGEAAKQQPERYRLNTPVAVIGVKGTDFLAKVTEQGLQAYVHEGAIVVSAVNSPGTQPPTSLQAGHAIEFAGSQATALGTPSRPVTSAELGRMFGMQLVAAGTPSAGPTAGRVAQLTADTHGRGNANPMQTDASVDNPNISLAGLSQSTQDLLHGARPSTPTTPEVPSLPTLPTQLRWGAFDSASQLPFLLPLPYSQALVGGHVTVGELGQYALWRDDPRGSMQPNVRGVADFAAVASEAYLFAGQQIQPVGVSNTYLKADFDRLQFSTGATLTATGMASQTFAAQGRINDEGIFSAVQANQRVAGAFSLDGREAGTLFNLTTNPGTIQGITLWKVK